MPAIKVRIKNRETIFCLPYPKDDLLPYFSFRPKGYIWMPAYRMGQWDGWIRLLKRDKVPTGLFLAMKSTIEKELKVRFRITKECTRLQFKEDSMGEARPYQKECVKAMIEASQRGGGLVLKATGSGKTLTTGLLLKRFTGVSCFVVDELALLHQAKAELQRVTKEKVGIVGESEFAPERITVATIQTLNLYRAKSKFVTWFSKIEILILDEIHIQLSKRNWNVIETIKPPAIFGLTATLELQKAYISLKAFAVAGPVCYTYPLERGVAEGYLSRGVCLAVQPDQMTHPYKKYSTDYSLNIVESNRRNQIVREIVECGIEQGHYCIV